MPESAGGKADGGWDMLPRLFPKLKELSPAASPPKSVLEALPEAKGVLRNDEPVGEVSVSLSSSSARFCIPLAELV